MYLSLLRIEGEVSKGTPLSEAQNAGSPRCVRNGQDPPVAAVPALHSGERELLIIRG